MAVFDVVGSAAGSSNAFSGLISIVSSPVLAVGGAADTSASPIIIINSTGLATGVADLSVAAITRISLPVGDASGQASVSTPLLNKYFVLIGTSTGSTEAEAFSPGRDVIGAIRSVLPDFLLESRIIKAIQEAQANEAMRLSAVIEQQLRNYFVDTSSEVGLSFRESELNIKHTSGKSIKQRRDSIKGKLQSPEIETKQRFNKKLNELIVCSVEDFPDEYRVTSTFLGKRGVPKEFADVNELVDRLLPAHLVYDFIFTYLPWSEVEEAGLTWEAAEKYTASELEEAFLIPFEGV